MDKKEDLDRPVKIQSNKDIAKFYLWKQTLSDQFAIPIKLYSLNVKEESIKDDL